MIKLLLILSFSLSIINANTEAEEKEKVLSVLKKYSETVACITNFKEQKPLDSFLGNVFTIDSDNEYGEATYYVLWYGDIGCLGGSGTGSFYVSKVNRGDKNKPFLVINDRAFGEAFSGINTRFIESIKQLDANHFVIVASKFAKDDPNCCPSMRYQYDISRKSRDWKLTSSKRLK